MTRDTVYFASDFHLGTTGKHSSKVREKIIVDWLRAIRERAVAIYFVGDIFDFWYEYKTVIPKGHSHFFAELRALVDSGVDVQFFTGNHDVWMFSYFPDEYGIPVHSQPLDVELQGKRLHIAHGDGLGPGDHGYKFIKKIFTNKVCQWLWTRLHPNFALWLMRKTSSTSRDLSIDDGTFDAANEWLVIYVEEQLKKKPADYYIFGHRHIPITHQLTNGHSTYLNLGDWLHNYTYAELKDGVLQLKSYTYD